MRARTLAALAAMVLSTSAVAQDTGFYGRSHAEDHDWYSKLNQPGTTYSCCNGNEHGGDCRPTRAFRGDDGFWHAQIDGNSHICASKGGYIFCFIGGSPKS
jgi:hypothetical protein